MAAGEFAISPVEGGSVIQGLRFVRPVRILRPDGFTDPVTLSLRPQSGFTASFDPSPITGDETVMTLTAESGVGVGSYTLVLDGAGGGFTASRSFHVEVRSAVHSVRLTPPAVSMAPGQRATVEVVVVGTSLPATLSIPSLPALTTATFDPNPTSSTSTLTLSTDLFAAPASHTLSVDATFADGGATSALLALTIEPPTGWVEMFRDAAVYWAMAIDRTTGTDGGLLGFAVGAPAPFPGVTRRSVDGGRSWEQGPAIDAANTPTIYDLEIKVQRIMAVGNAGAGYLSTDSGSTWTPAATRTGNTLYGVAFSDVANGVAVGDGTVVRSTDGGLNYWPSSVLGSPYVLLDVSYVAGVAFAVGQDGVIFRSTSHMDNWTALASGTTAHLRGVSFADASNGMVVGDGGIVLVTSDGGATWTPRGIPGVAARLDRVAMLDATTATVGGLNRLHQTTNAGLFWGRDLTSLATFDRVLAIHLRPDNTAVTMVQNADQGGVTTFLRRD